MFNEFPDFFDVDKRIEKNDDAYGTFLLQLGGADDETNLKNCDMEVYWGLLSQMIR